MQVIEIYSHRSLKYNWIDFSSKQRSFYFTKSSRGPDPTTQRAGIGPRDVCLTPLVLSIVLTASVARWLWPKMVSQKLLEFAKSLFTDFQLQSAKRSEILLKKVIWIWLKRNL